MEGPKAIIGLMGPGEGASDRVMALAENIGSTVARNGWILLTGGRAAGVMESASRGAKNCGGTTIGIVPGNDKKGVSKYVDIVIVTGLGNARNNVNVLSSDVVVAMVEDMGMGTLSEIALARKNGKHVVLVGEDLGKVAEVRDFLCSVDAKEKGIKEGEVGGYSVAVSVEEVAVAVGNQLRRTEK
eukprot:comp10291_c0_seq1/m.5101 comp10291_c0_seq1/g.5101  ORF comp10291_c0_seq1/g.5101 comp10291_c0_seq1/m.5101 type:complete len:185 (-) comp10291_c0_seq1:50-604(-)